MPTFSPPVQSNGVPPVLPEGDPDQHPLGRRLMRYYRARPGGDTNNVYYRIVSGAGTPAEVGVVTNIDPYTTYHTDGSVDVAAWSDVAQVWWAGHEPVAVTAAQQAALEDAGYTVVP